MKRLILIFCSLLLGGSYSLGQVRVDFSIDFDTVDVPKYEFKGLGESQTYFRMNFASDEILNPKALKNIKGKNVTKIELVHTKYPTDFEHTKLNLQRVLNLYLLKPELLKDDDIEWKLVRQTACNDSTAYNFFHGFVLTYTNKTSEPRITTKKKYMQDVISGEKPVEDSTILKVMDRQKWKNMVIVSDFTGSMAPYVSELLFWHKLNLKRNKDKIESFLFFNDGNGMPDSEKEIGSAGGIYPTHKKNIDSVMHTAIKTLANGDGGDKEENDLEALIEATKKYPGMENLILIADNKSKMRDISLVEKLNKPVHVILCGTEDGINKQYLDMAYKTGGSVHTIEKDIENLVELSEGDIIHFGKESFKIVDGKFTKITNL